MIKDIKHQDVGIEVVVAKLLTNYVTVTKKIEDIDSFVKLHQTFDAGFVAYMISWQGNRGLVPNGDVDSETWTKIAKSAPTCSTSKNRISGYTLALQLLLDTNIDCDGVYGPRTKAAVVVFQKAKKLSADGITGPKTWNALIVGKQEKQQMEPSTKPATGTFKQPVDYKQYDSRWGSKMYSNHNDKGQTMSNSACGPTSMADIVATLRDSSKNPYDLAKLAMSWGDRTNNSGTAWTFFIPHIMEHYDFVGALQTKNLEVLKACLDDGGYVVCSMAPGYWTKGGHFICAWKYDSTYIYCNDPASTSRKKQKLTEFVKERKQYFCFYPKSSADPVQPEKAETAETNTVTEVKVNGKEIIDISKWQGAINFDKLKNEVAFVIARAGVGSDPDPKFDEYAEAMRLRGIPFGVYCYSYAGTEAKARDEAQKLIQRAGKYNPLFYVMDAEEEKITNVAIKAFASELRNQGATRIGCYVAHHRYTQYKFADIANMWDFVWIPCYGKNDGTIAGSKKPSYPCDLWQYTSTGKIAGISGSVDMNTITGQGKNLEWFLNGTATSGNNDSTPEQPTDSKKVRIVNGNVNVRTAPNTSGKILGVANKGETLEYGGKIDAGTGWISVVYNGQNAWISNKYGELV